MEKEEKLINLNKEKELIDKLLNDMSFTKTDNGALAHETTQNSNLDLFGSDVRIRKGNNEKIVEIFRKFEKAFKEDSQLALQNFFNIIDVRGGKGEKGITPLLILYLNSKQPQTLIKYLSTIVKLSRWDRLLNNFSLFNEEVKDAILQLILSNTEDGLMFKWLPSIGASSHFTIKNAKAIARKMKLEDREYRIWVAEGRKKYSNKLIETSLTTKNYKEIEVKAIPKLALKKYSKVLWANIGTKMRVFSEKLSTGEIKVNVDVLAPYDFYDRVRRDWSLSEEEDQLKIELWNNLWTQQKKMNLDCLPVIDVSGSMSGNPEKVARSLGIYVAEQNKGYFKNKVFIFSNDTKVLDLSNLETFSEKLRDINKHNDVANTNLESVFKKILSEFDYDLKFLPKNLLLISDMQFDSATDSSWDDVIYKKYKKEFQSLGIKFPNIIFWNVNATDKTFPILKDDIGVCMMYGTSIHNLKALEKLGEGALVEHLPMSLMKEALEKYKEYLK